MNKNALRLIFWQSSICIFVFIYRIEIYVRIWENPCWWYRTQRRSARLSRLSVDDRVYDYGAWAFLLFFHWAQNRSAAVFTAPLFFKTWPYQGISAFLAICMSSHAVAADIPVLFVHVGTWARLIHAVLVWDQQTLLLSCRAFAGQGQQQQQHRQRDNDEVYDTGETIVLLFFPSTNSRLPATNQRLFLFFASFVYLVSTVPGDA